MSFSLNVIITCFMSLVVLLEAKTIRLHWECRHQILSFCFYPLQSNCSQTLGYMEAEIEAGGLNRPIRCHRHFCAAVKRKPVCGSNGTHSVSFKNHCYFCAEGCINLRKGHSFYRRVPKKTCSKKGTTTRPTSPLVTTTQLLTTTQTTRTTTATTTSLSTPSVPKTYSSDKLAGIGLSVSEGNTKIGNTNKLHKSGEDENVKSSTNPTRAQTDKGRIIVSATVNRNLDAGIQTTIKPIHLETHPVGLVVPTTEQYTITMTNNNPIRVVTDHSGLTARTTAYKKEDDSNLKTTSSQNGQQAHTDEVNRKNTDSTTLQMYEKGITTDTTTSPIQEASEQVGKASSTLIQMIDKDVHAMATGNQIQSQATQPSDHAREAMTLSCVADNSCTSAVSSTTDGTKSTHNVLHETQGQGKSTLENMKQPMPGEDTRTTPSPTTTKTTKDSLSLSDPSRISHTSPNPILTNIQSTSRRGTIKSSIRTDSTLRNEAYDSITSGYLSVIPLNGTKAEIAESRTFHKKPSNVHRKPPGGINIKPTAATKLSTSKAEKEKSIKPNKETVTSLSHTTAQSTTLEYSSMVSNYIISHNEIKRLLEIKECALPGKSLSCACDVFEVEFPEWPKW